MTTLGTRIRRARERKRWTQQQLADALAVSLRTVGDWERDKAAPRNSIGALEAVLGVSLGEEREDRPRIPANILAAIEHSDMTPDEKEEFIRAGEQILIRRREARGPDVTLHGALGPLRSAPPGPVHADGLIPSLASLSPQPRTPQPAGESGSPA